MCLIVVILLTFSVPPWGASDIFFVPHILTEGVNKARSVFAIDVDSDGDCDVLSSGGNGQITWHENRRGIPPSFVSHTISNTAAEPYLVRAADLDDEGDIDLISASQGDDMIAWYKTDGAAQPSYT